MALLYLLQIASDSIFIHNLAIQNYKMDFKKICWVFLPAAIALSSCDKISNPLKTAESTSSLPHTPPTFKDSSTNYTTYKVLLEDCMGHYCGNCPPAAQEADSLTTFNSHVISMEDHMGFFADTAGESGGPAQPPGLPAGAFSEDLRCSADSDWEAFFGYQTFPKGMIDRVYFSSTSKSNTGIGQASWITVIDSLIGANSQPKVTINIHDSCWVPQRLIGVQITLNVPAPLDGNKYYLETLIVEDSCFGWQLDDNATPADNPNYDHRFVLRGAFGNNSGGNHWGNLIPVSVTSAGGTYTTWQTYDFTNGENGKAINWNMEHCYIVAFVYLYGSTYNIIQAERIKVE
jgi:hypothetical protein